MNDEPVKRYDHEYVSYHDAVYSTMKEADDGDWRRNEDYETLRAENERLKKDFTEKFQIASECQRLRELVTLQAGELATAQAVLKEAAELIDRARRYAALGLHKDLDNWLHKHAPEKL